MQHYSFYGHQKEPMTFSFSIPPIWLFYALAVVENDLLSLFKTYPRLDICSKMVNEDKVSLLEEPYPWNNLKQRSKRYPRSLELIIAVAFSSLGFILGVGFGPYWPGRLDTLCIARTAMPCE